MAGNMLVMALVTKGIELAASAIDHLVNKSKYAAEAMEEAQQEITDSQNKLKEVSDTVSENKDRFLGLAQGVDQFSNNVSLSKDDYQEYLDISNKLADIAPDLVTGYDEQGNALLAIGSNAEDTSKKLQDIIDKQQTIANQKLVDNLPQIADGIYNEVEDAKTGIDSLQGQLEDAKNTSANLNIGIKGSHGRIDFKDNDYNRFGTNNGFSNGWEWISAQSILMSEIELYGSIVWSSSGYDTGNANHQFELFVNSKSAINNLSAWYWFKDIASASRWFLCHNTGNANYDNAGVSGRDVRPRFVLAT